MRSCSKIKVDKLKGFERECYEAWQNYECEYSIQSVAPDAIWESPIVRPEPPEDPTKIVNWGKPKEERKFPHYSDDFLKEMEFGYKSEEGSKENEKYQEFIDEEYKRRYNGFFFYNGDKLEWVTDRHYMFLQYWKIPVTIGGRKRAAQPRFKDAQRDVNYAKWVARKDKACAGVIFTAPRRFGKSADAISDGYWDTTENSDSMMAIQSKTDKDAQKVFNKVIYSWQKLPAFWRPTDTGETRVSKVLRFSEKKRTSDADDREYTDVLNSEIFYTNRAEEALDGDYLSYILHDEAGKLPKQVDCNERWNISRECLFDNGKIVGFGIVTTTVEDMEKYGSDKYELLWNRSNPKERLPDGKTDSNLYRLFIPAYYGFDGDEDIESFVDEWGYTNTGASRAYFKKMYNAKNNDPSFARKYPITIRDAFTKPSGGNSFSIQRIRQQEEFNMSLYNGDAVRGNFVWKDGVKWGEVVWYPDEVSGRWWVAIHPPEIDRNRYEMRGMHRFPTRQYFKTGADPIDHKGVANGSMPIATTILDRKLIGHDYAEKSWACVYAHRHEDPNAFYEDMILQNQYYSSYFLAESNKYGVLNYFAEKGYDGYCLQDPLETDWKKLKRGQKGLHNSSNGSNNDKRNELMTMLQCHIYDEIGKKNDGSYGFCPFPELLKDWAAFSPEKWTDHDYTVAAMMTLAACRPSAVKKKQQINITDWLPKYN